MTVNSQRLLLAAAGAGAAAAGLYVDDVFSTYLYTGTGASHTIANGIDLSGEGGLVWIKQRNATIEHFLFDTERGATKSLSSNDTTSEYTSSTTLTGFGSTGFTLSSSNFVNGTTSAPRNYCSWTFRKAPGFFDIVTYTGTGVSDRLISHSLGSAPGCIIIKRLTASGYEPSDRWGVYHRSLGVYSSDATKNMFLNNNNAASNSGLFREDGITSTTFEISNDPVVNASGVSYVAYIFAHDDQSFGTDSDEAIIKCGSYTGNGSTQTIDLGFEPQWVMAKRTNDTGNWNIYDIMRGMASLNDDAVLSANTTSTESATVNFLEPTPTGFQINTGNGAINNTSDTYVYVAIRRPHKPLEAGTDVFAMDTGNSSSTIPAYDSNFPVDFAISRIVGSTGAPHFTSRLTGKRFLRSDNNFAQSDDADYTWDSNVGWGKNWYSDYHSWMFRRASGFMDVVTYQGNGANRALNHNLTVPPELLIVKNRSDAHDWFVYAEPLGNDKELSLNLTSKANTSSRWQSTTPTSTVFYVSSNTNVNANGSYFTAYLFASLSGVSKIGSYTGTGAAQNIDCGFTAGARFVLIKRTDAIGEWVFYDTLRGIVAGNDPELALNTSSAQATHKDAVDPYSQGFALTTNQGDTNVTGGTYLFLAIA